MIGGVNDRKKDQERSRSKSLGAPGGSSRAPGSDDVEMVDVPDDVLQYLSRSERKKLGKK